MSAPTERSLGWTEGGGGGRGSPRKDIVLWNYDKTPKQDQVAFFLIIDLERLKPLEVMTSLKAEAGYQSCL